jgi:tetratricopeptide (TPR) repeat protein
MGFYGDWRTIYDFNATTILRGATSVIHDCLQFLFCQADRSGFIEIAANSTEGMQGKVSQLETQAAANSHDPQLQLELIEAYRRGGKLNQARQHAQKLVKENPRLAGAYLQLAMIESAGKQHPSRKASDYAAQAVSLGLNKPQAVAMAHLLIGQYHLAINQPQQTIDHMDQAIETVKSTGTELLPSLLYTRAQAHRRRQQYEPAYRDIERAIQLSKEDNKSEADIAFLQQEMAIIQQHAGRTFT